MRKKLGSLAVLGLTLMLATSVFAAGSGDTTNSNTNDPNANANTAAASADPASDASSQPSQPDATATLPSDPAAQASSKAKAQSSESTVAPIAATTGTLGLFTLETGETLPRRGWSFSGYLNKFERMPGSVSLLQLGVNVGYGITNRLNLYANFDPYQHVSESFPHELSLDSGFGLYRNTIYRSLTPGGRPGYVQDYPFAATSGGGVGGIIVGLKYGLLEEDLGQPVSLSVRNDFIIPTVTGLNSSLQNETQTGAFADEVALAISKTWPKFITLTANVGYEFTSNPTQGGTALFNLADQVHSGVGFIILPRKRVQIMSEYTSTVFTGVRTPDTSFSAEDPLDGVWGLRLYLNNNIAVDLGYRYMLNLSGAKDRSGFIVKLGDTILPAKPAPVNHPPTVTCSADKSSVVAGSGDMIAITATASDPDGDPINYTWMASGGNLNGTGPQVRWMLSDAAPGSYTATVRVDDGRGGNASCSANGTVTMRPNRPPTVSLSSDRDSVLIGERVHFTATASDPDGDPLSYMWSTNGGQLSGNGATDDLDTTGLMPGSYTVTVRVDDGRGGAADASKTIMVNAPPPAPQASRISGCDFKQTNSSRVDNVCKRVLDDAAVRLQNDPNAKLVIVGYSDPKERRSAQLAGDRGSNAVKYLGTKGIDSSRITTRTGTGQAGAGQANRRIDVIFVPQGATY